MAELPKWAENKKKRDLEYSKLHKRRIVFDLNRNTEPELIEVFESIPNKSQWFKNCLMQYAKEHTE